MAAIAQMKLLVSLSQIDGNIGDSEVRYIEKIGLANGLDQDEIAQLLRQTHPIIIPNNLTAEQKFDFIFSLVQLMKIDERMFKEEILFCSKVAASLGYDQQLMFDLMLHVNANPMETSGIDDLRLLAKKYLL